MKPWTGALLGLAVSLAVAAVGLWDPPVLSDLERELLDLRFLLRGEAPLTGDVVVAAVDARSIDEVGRWPWPRRTAARLVANLCEAGASAVALDIVFSERERDPLRASVRDLAQRPGLAEDIRRELEALTAETSGDEALARAVAACSERVVLGYFFRAAGEADAETAPPEGFLRDAPVSTALVRSPRFQVPSATGVETNLPEVLAAGRHHGFFNLLPDPDGQVRRYQLVWGYEDLFFPALALEAIRVHDRAPIRLEVSREGEVVLQVGDRSIPADESGTQLLDFRGPGGTFPHLSAVDLLEGEGLDRVAGKVVFVGVTEVGIKDVRPTPLDPLFPGTEVHATVADSILRGVTLRRTTTEILADLAAILLLGPLLGFLLQRLPRASLGIAAALAAAVLWWLAVQAAFAWGHRWIHALYPLMVIGGTWSAVTLWRALSVERRAREIRDVFEKYVAHSVVEEMLTDPARVRLGGERRELTILFSDIRGFTSISEQMEPEDLVQFLNAYFSPMTEIILRRRGTFDKYMGDAMMAFWGAPLAMEDHAGEACRAALEMCRRLEHLKRESHRIDLSALDVGIGLNTGPVSVGNMGSEQIYDYTVIGDTANLASRLEGANKTYGTRVLISESTWKAVGGGEGDPRGGFVARRLDRVRVKGKAEPVEVLELLGEGEEARRKWGPLVERFEAALDHWFAGRFEMARDGFEETFGLRPEDGPSRLYLERCEAFLEAEAPADWDGVFVMETK